MIARRRGPNAADYEIEQLVQVKRTEAPMGRHFRPPSNRQGKGGHRVAAIELLEVCHIYTDTYSDFYGVWCWRSVPRSGAEGRDIYIELMEGRAANETLRDLMPFFEKIIREIEGASEG